MSDVMYRVKIKGELHEMSTLTLGQARQLRKHFDVRDIGAMEMGDPDVIAGLAYLAVRAANPAWEHVRALNYVEDLSLDDFDDADDVEPDPTPAAVEAAEAGA